MAVIDRRVGKLGVRWRARVSVRGYPRQTKTFRLKKDAEGWARETEDQLRTGRYRPSAAGKTLQEAIDRFLSENDSNRTEETMENYRGTFAFWAKHLGKIELRYLDANRITTAWAKWPGAVSTANVYKSMLSVLLGRCVRPWGWIAVNPCNGIRKRSEGQKRCRFLSRDKIEKLVELSRPNHELHLAVTLALSTGARIGELLAIRWEHVSSGGNFAYLAWTKNKTPRRVAVTGHGLASLQNTPRGTGLVIGSTYKKISYAFKRVIREAGIEDFRFHDLRHTCASYLAMSGSSLVEIAEILGHKDLNSTMRYAHLAPGHQTTVLERMHRYLERPQEPQNTEPD